MKLISTASKIVERAPVPDLLTRAGIDMLCRRTARSLTGGDPSVEAAFARAMALRPIAVHTQDANEQHYEVPQDFSASCSDRTANIPAAIMADLPFRS